MQRVKRWNLVGYWLAALLMVLSLTACGLDNVPSAANSTATAGGQIPATGSLTTAAVTTPVQTTASAPTTAASATTVAATTIAASLPTVTPPQTTAATTAVATTASATTSQPQTTTAPTTASLPTTGPTSVPATTAPATRRRLLAYIENGQLHAIDPTTKDDRVLISNEAQSVVGRPDWSPDSTSLIVPVRAKGGKNTELYTVDLVGGKPSRFLAAPDGASDNDPRFSPDGKTVLFTRTIGSRHELWLVDQNRQNARKLTNGQQGSWSPDSQRIAFVTDGTIKPDTQLPQNNALHLISAKGQNEWEPTSTSKLPTDLSGQGFPFSPSTLAVQYPTWLDGGKTIGFTTVGHSGLLVTISSTNAKDLKVWDTQYEGGFGTTDSAAQGGLLVYETFPPSGFSGVSLMNTSGKPDLTKPGNVSVDNPRQGLLASHPALSSDGTRLAYVKLTKADAGGPDLKVANGILTVVQMRGNQPGDQQELLKSQIEYLVWAK